MNKLLTKSLLIPVVLAVVSLMVTQAHADLIVNGGFDLDIAGGTSGPGSFYGWTLSGNTSNTGVVDQSVGVTPVSGDYQAAFGSPSLATISQTFATVAGQYYDFSFYVDNTATGNNQFTASIGADQVYSVTDGSAFSYTPVNYNHYLATSNFTTVAFSSSHSGAGFYLLDNVSVTDSSGVNAVPEPASMALMGLGVAGVAFRAVRRKRGAVPVQA